MARPTVLALLALVVAVPAGAQRLSEEWGLDYRGGDYRSFRARDVEQCQNACGRDSRCRAYTFRLESGDCFLKDRVRSPTRDPNTVTGVKGGSGGGWSWGDVRDMSEDWGVDRRGGDYSKLRVDDVRACKWACSRDARCRAYAFGLESRSCYLKDEVYRASRDDDKVSGTKRGVEGGWSGSWGGGSDFEESTGLDRRGGDYAAFITRTPDDCKRACARDAHCRAYTFILDEHKCYLKDVAMPLQRNPNAVTGTKRGG